MDRPDSCVFFNQQNSDNLSFGQKRKMNGQKLQFQLKQPSAFNGNLDSQLQLNRLQSLHSIKVSFESLSGAKIEGLQREQSGHSVGSISPRALFGGKFQSKEKEFEVESNNMRPLFGQGENFPTIERAMFNLNLESQREQEIQKWTEYEKKKDTRTFYSGHIELSINNSNAYDFQGRVSASSTSQDQIIVCIKSQCIQKQKIKIKKREYRKMKKYGRLEAAEVCIWEQNTAQWVPNYSVTVVLTQFELKRANKPL